MNIFEGWEKFISYVEKNSSNILWNPITWIILALIAVGIYGLYDVSENTRKNGLGNVMRQLLQVLLDTTSDVINLLSGLTGFIGVLRTLLFGRLGKRVLAMLINYAIVFMSTASFITTMTGLSQVVSWPLAAFISFGVQVSILIYSAKLNEANMEEDPSEQRLSRPRYYLLKEFMKAPTANSWGDKLNEKLVLKKMIGTNGESDGESDGENDGENDGESGESDGESADKKE